MKHAVMMDYDLSILDDAKEFQKKMKEAIDELNRLKYNLVRDTLSRFGIFSYEKITCSLNPYGENYYNDGKFIFALSKTEVHSGFNGNDLANNSFSVRTTFRLSEEEIKP